MHYTAIVVVHPIRDVTTVVVHPIRDVTTVAVHPIYNVITDKTFRMGYNIDTSQM